MTTIHLMFHDVFNASPNESGFCGTGPNLYKIDKQKFLSYVELASNSSQDFIFTFDDGGVSFYNEIAPMLEKKGEKGIFFIATKFIGQKGFLTSEQIVDLDRRGHVIGSHSHSHRRLSELSDEDIFEEWKKSSDILSSILKHPIEYASIPNGYQSDSVIEMAKKAGYKYLYTSIPTTKIKDNGNIDLIGRFVLTKESTLHHVQKLQSPLFRIALRQRSFLLMLLQRIMGSYYKKIRNLIFK